MDRMESAVLKNTLGRAEIHQQWINAYRTPENGRFYEEAFDYIIGVLKPPKNSTILDAGCGTCAHSIRLANRGCFVVGADFSEEVLKMAEVNIESRKLQGMIKLQRENILSLSFENETFDYILCWGVLMHIADLEKAISEVIRVLKPGGIIVIGEVNMLSLQSIILRNLKKWLKKEKADLKRTQAGLEYWSTTSSGRLLTRHANIRWLMKRFKNDGFTVKKRVSGQFTELYTKCSSLLLRSCIHIFNNVWFKYVRIPYPALGNIVILQKKILGSRKIKTFSRFSR